MNTVNDRIHSITRYVVAYFCRVSTNVATDLWRHRRGCHGYVTSRWRRWHRRCRRRRSHLQQQQVNTVQFTAAGHPTRFGNSVVQLSAKQQTECNAYEIDSVDWRPSSECK